MKGRVCGKRSVSGKKSTTVKNMIKDLKPRYSVCCAGFVPDLVCCLLLVSVCVYVSHNI